MWKKIISILLILLSLSIYAQPAFAAEKKEVIFKEKIPGYEGAQYLNLSQEMPKLVGMDSGTYIGPEYPFVLYKISARAESTIYINFTHDFTTQDIMNGAWKWRILIPVIGDIEDLGIKIDGKCVIHTDKNSVGTYAYSNGKVEVYRTYTTTYSDLKHLGLINNTRFGELLTVTYPIFPQEHTISIYLLVRGDITLHFVRENSIATTTTILQSRKIEFNNTIGVAMEFLDGFGDAGMAGYHVFKEKTIHIIPSTGDISSEDYYFTISFPIYIEEETKLKIQIDYKNYTLGTLHEISNQTIESGFHYITLSTAHKAHEVDGVSLSANEDFTLLFCASSQNGDNSIFETLPNQTSLFPLEHWGRWDNSSQYPSTDFPSILYLNPLGILFDFNMTKDQFAKVLYLSGVTIYDFGFASIQHYTNGTYIITEEGSFKTWIEYKNITIKSLGAKIEEDIFGHGVTEGGDILTVILNTVMGTYNAIKKIWDFLRNIGNILWAVLMKFVGWILNSINWLLDLGGTILNYVLYIIIPIATMLIIAYIARWAKGLKIEEGEK